MQFTGIDALCYYGSYPLSGSSELNARFFLVLWLITLAFLSTLLLFKRGLRNFFRLPCPVVDAGFIAVTAEVEEEVLMKSTTALVSWVRSTKDWIRRRKPSNTYRLTVPILSNADGIPYYELQAKR